MAICVVGFLLRRQKNKKIISLLYICFAAIIGNVCRSPIADAVFQQILKARGIRDQWMVDSAAIEDKHTGNRPNYKASKILEKHNIPYRGRARQIKEEDFYIFDYIFGMDENNICSLNGLAPSNIKATILLLGDFDPEGDRIIRDPYFDSGIDGFEKCYQQCKRSCIAFLEQL